MKLNTIKHLKGKIVLQTGLHIGAGDTEIHIGGTDSPVVKHPETLKPYIPGSSLKGKMRSLLELTSGLISFTEGKPVSCETYTSKTTNEEDKRMALNILKLFGAGANANSADIPGLYTTRLSFSDCFVNEDCKDKILSEIKSENSIDRSSGTAANPRFIERVPQGIKFDFELSIKEYDDDNASELEKILKKGLRLLELDAIGGSSSRGYGKIKFESLKLDGEDFDYSKSEDESL